MSEQPTSNPYYVVERAYQEGWCPVTTPTANKALGESWLKEAQGAWLNARHRLTTYTRTAEETPPCHPDPTGTTREPPHCPTCGCGLTPECIYPVCLTEEPGCVIGCQKRERGTESMNIGVYMDEQQAAAIPEAERCDCCGGTGNMLLSMFFRCLACGGDGRTRGKEAEAAAQAEWEARFPQKLPSEGKSGE